ncbi:carbohydrate ABC transporter permease [Anaerocellum diazotrophicum]|uniref:Sugar ABC transporter permease n=1 Tax=Caldicellulosiruptor diazotrophicus TaxID=2806205 RepID=A0ABN6E4Z1_9FIRM|nr:carbohydrate ABC transporter permease [Caldicellulosiruptor diazotrophicus]BCS80174.1 sugar ABC transporter permease [Caldicellulosiruptor diazotrophicus]
MYSQSKKAKNTISLFITYAFLILFGLFMIYPLLWVVSAAFKSNDEIFKSLSLIPQKIVTDSFIKGWQGTGQYTFGRFFVNNFILVIPVVFFTIISSTLVAYGFARFNFPLKRLFFVILISTLMLPDSINLIPRYILFNAFGWVDSYKPFIIPSMFASTPFFVFMMIQFMRGLPREIEEAAIIDGCNSFQILLRVTGPLCKTAMISMGIFQFIWTWNDFLGPLIYINSVEKYTIALGLRMCVDSAAAIAWNQIMAMTVIAMLPCIIIFFAAQKYFVEGIATSGIKG